MTDLRPAQACLPRCLSHRYTSGPAKKIRANGRAAPAGEYTPRAVVFTAAAPLSGATAGGAHSPAGAEQTRVLAHANFLAYTETLKLTSNRPIGRRKRRTRSAFRDVDARQAAACRRQRARRFTSRGRSRCTRASRHDAPEEERKVPDPGNTSYDVLSTTRFFSLNCLQSVGQSQSQRLGNEINHTFNLGWRASCNFRSQVC